VEIVRSDVREYCSDEIVGLDDEGHLIDAGELIQCMQTEACRRMADLS